MPETHGVLYMPDGSFQTANFMGPGTEVVQRISRGDEGKTYMDRVAELHDIEYMLAVGESNSQEETIRKARAADERMLLYSARALNGKQDHTFNVTQGGGLIRAKTFLEDWNIIDRSRFVGKYTARYLNGSAERDITEGEMLHRRRKEILQSGPLADEHAYRTDYDARFSNRLETAKKRKEAEDRFEGIQTRISL